MSPEYSIVGGGIALALVAALPLLSDQIMTTFGLINCHLAGQEICVITNWENLHGTR